MIRTIWLGLTFLIILAAAGSFRFAYGNFDPANATGISRPESNRIVVARIVQQPVANIAPPPVAYVPPAPADAESAKPKADLDPVEPLLRMPPAIATASSPSPPWRELTSLEAKKIKTQKIRRKDAEFAKPDQDAIVPLLRVPPAIVATGSSSPPSRDLSSFATPQPKDQKIRHRNAKKEAVVDGDQAATEPKACQLEDFDAVRWAFNLPTGCFS